MDILDRVTTSSNICKVHLAFSGVASPSVIQGWQPFYNTLFTDAVFNKTYASLSSIDFDETESESPAGPFYTQLISFRFPVTDKHRAERIALLRKIKFVKLSFTNGLDLVVGRNDFTQNARPSIKVKTNAKLCEVTIECKSTFPAAYTPSVEEVGDFVFYINENMELIEVSETPSGLTFAVNENMELVQISVEPSFLNFKINDQGQLTFTT